MLKIGSNHMDINTKIHKMKGIMHSPKIQQTEPACINDPNNGELITDRETIKKVSLDHCLNILKKNEIREEDKEELRGNIKRHNAIMSKDNSDQELEWDTYTKVLKRIKSKGKKMFDLLNKAGREYKVAIFHYMRRILKEEVIPHSFRKTWLLGIWKRKGSALDLNMMRYVHLKAGRRSCAKH